MTPARSTTVASSGGCSDRNGNGRDTNRPYADSLPPTGRAAEVGVGDPAEVGAAIRWHPGGASLTSGTFRATARSRPCQPLQVIGDFTTERLELRPMDTEDLALLVELNSDDEVMRFITGRASTVEESAEELEHALGTRWMVFERASKDFVGWVGAIPSSTGEEFDVGWRFRREAWGRGFATEASRELIDRLFSCGAQRVFAQTMAVNSRSRATMERLGLRLGRTFMLDVEDPLPGTELGEVEYEQLRAAWEAYQRR